jgi:carboxymethylenebutenolidase
VVRSSVPALQASGSVTGVDVAKDIRIPFLGLFGEKDTNPPPEDARKFGELVRQHNPSVEIVVYPDASHGFHADYRPSYHAEAAQDAWKRCVTHFRKHLTHVRTAAGERRGAG